MSDVSTATARQPPQRVAPAAVYAISPPLGDYTDRVLFGDVWKRPQLAPRDRSLVTIVSLIVLGRAAQLRGHLNRALDNGLVPSEISEIIAHLAFYSGWPTAMSAVPEALAVYEQRGIALDAAAPLIDEPHHPPADEAERGAEVERMIGALSTQLAGYTNTQVFGDLWHRTGISLRDRALVTIVGLVALDHSDQIPLHVRTTGAASVSAEDLSEVLTHLAFYTGWPRVLAAVPALTRWREGMTK